MRELVRGLIYVLAEESVPLRKPYVQLMTPIGLPTRHAFTKGAADKLIQDTPFFSTLEKAVMIERIYALSDEMLPEAVSLSDAELDRVCPNPAVFDETERKEALADLALAGFDAGTVTRLAESFAQTLYSKEASIRLKAWQMTELMKDLTPETEWENVVRGMLRVGSFANELMHAICLELGLRDPASLEAEELSKYAEDLRENVPMALWGNVVQGAIARKEYSEEFAEKLRRKLGIDDEGLPDAKDDDDNDYVM